MCEGDAGSVCRETIIYPAFSAACLGIRSSTASSPPQFSLLLCCPHLFSLLIFCLIQSVFICSLASIY